MTKHTLTGKDLYNASQFIAGYRNASSTTERINRWMTMSPDELREDLRNQHQKLETTTNPTRRKNIEQIISMHKTRLEWADRWDDVVSDATTPNRNTIKGEWEYDVIFTSRNGCITAMLEGFDVSHTAHTEQEALDGLKENIENSNSVGMESLSLHTPE